MSAVEADHRGGVSASRLPIIARSRHLGVSAVAVATARIDAGSRDNARAAVEEAEQQRARRPPRPGP